ncbi:hypothetical protein AMECASPLE_021494 [Ameca splendens]|uniref:Uncharacterized protein n=1 Tax=Ameca splendens TaxID=208324 RepID=A0ABV0ZDN0_9TELE
MFQVESGFKGHTDNHTAISTDRGRSSPVPAIRPRVQSQQASNSPPPALEFIPYLRTAEVFNLDPLEPADTLPPGTHSGPPPPVSSHRDPLLHPEMLRSSQRQQEILRGLAQLRQVTQTHLPRCFQPVCSAHTQRLFYCCLLLVPLTEKLLAKSRALLTFQEITFKSMVETRLNVEKEHL